MDGLFNIYKEAGMTSHDVVAKMRRILGIKTVGHTGTLDPNATGVLPVAVGRATKVIEYMENDDKIYNTELILGITTDTEDIWGKILSEKDLSQYELNEDNIKDIIMTFKGKQIQVPPMYSALKINGKKLYELAREGKNIERKGREIEIFDIYGVSIKENVITFSVHCSKGTYIRTLCNDIGERLGTGAVMSKLERVKAGVFRKEASAKLEDIEKSWDKYIIDLESVIERFPIVRLSEVEAFRYMNGIKIMNRELDDGTYRIYIDNKLYGICTIIGNSVKKSKKIIG